MKTSEKQRNHPLSTLIEACQEELYPPPHEEEGFTTESRHRRRNFLEARKALGEIRDQKYRILQLDFDEIPNASMPAVLETGNAQGFLYLLEKTAENRFRVRLPDSRESVVEGRLLQKAHTGVSAVPRRKLSLDSIKSVAKDLFGVIRNHQSSVIASLVATIALIWISLFTMHGYRLAVPPGEGPSFLFASIAVFIAALLSHGIADLFDLLEKRGLKRRKLSDFSNSFSFSHVKPALDLLAWPFLFGLAAYTGGMSMAFPFAASTCLLVLYFCTTSKLQQLLAFPRQWANRFRCAVFVATLLPMYSRFFQNRLDYSQLIACLILSSVGVFLIVKTAPLFRMIRLRFLGESVRFERQNEPAVEEEPSETFLEVKGVSFRYPGASRDAISDVSMRISRGEKIGFFGPHGSGKSTLCRVAAGAFQPTKGSIEIGGKLGYLPQDFSILKGTLLSNILTGEETSHIEKTYVEKMAAVSGLGEWIASLPQGLETPISEGGNQLKLLQRKQLALTRALVNQPDVLVLDDPLSGLNKLEAEAFAANIDSYCKAKPDAILLVSLSNPNGPLSTVLDRIFGFASRAVAEKTEKAA